MTNAIDGRCSCGRCEERTQDTYQMRSTKCMNCLQGPFIITYRKGDRAVAQDCPNCGVSRSVTPVAPVEGEGDRG